MYQALYRKYRAHNFWDVYGQEEIVTILKNSLVYNKTSHAYIFSGPRGTGKTTLSRIIAKSINCLHLNEGEPCNECDNCLQINDNNCIDIIEIDAASNNGVDEIREINNKVKLLPSSLKYKVYIIDEVHMLTIGAFNALLKTLEEPPEHVVFILATTELHKVPITVLSRCQCFLLKKIQVDTIVSKLNQILSVEKIQVEKDVLTAIAESADGALRDALSSLDQLLSFSNPGEPITFDMYKKINGIISINEISSFLKFIFTQDKVSLLSFLNDITASGNDVVQIMNQIMGYLHSQIIEYYSSNCELFSSVNDYIMLANYINLLLPDMKRSFNAKMLLEFKLLEYMIKCENNQKLVKMPENYFPGNNLVEKNSGETLENYFPGNNLVEYKDSNPVETKDNAPVEINSDTPSGDNVDKMILVPTNKIMSDELINIRINNSFCNANKDILESMKSVVENLKTSNNNLVSLLVDGLLRVASSTNAIVSFKYDSLISRAEQKILELESLFEKECGNSVKLVFIHDDRWELTKNEYIVNMKNKVTYNYIEEPESLLDETVYDNNEVSEIKSLFGEMVEIED